jgi:hypothetical protein
MGFGVIVAAVLIKPIKFRKKRWFLPFWSVIAIAMLAVLLGGTFIWLGWQIYFAAYKEPDKRWGDLIALTPQIIAVFTIVGGAISWLAVRNEKRKEQLSDPAEVSITTYYEPSTYVYSVNISICKDTFIREGVHVIELFGKAGKVLGRQLITHDLLEQSLSYKFKINKTAQRFHLGYDDIYTVKSYFLYKSKDLYWRASSGLSERDRLVSPRDNFFKANGSLGFFKNNLKELESNLERM